MENLNKLKMLLQRQVTHLDNCLLLGYGALKLRFTSSRILPYWATPLKLDNTCSKSPRWATAHEQRLWKGWLSVIIPRRLVWLQSSGGQVGTRGISHLRGKWQSARQAYLHLSLSLFAAVGKCAGNKPLCRSPVQETAGAKFEIRIKNKIDGKLQKYIYI